MPFQATVSDQIGAGVVGELFLEGPLRAQPARLDSTNPAHNVVGRAFTWESGATGSWANNGDAANPAPMVVEAGGAGAFAGILANPKVYVGQGTVAGGTLAPTMTLPNGAMGEFVEECAGIMVALGTASAPGQSVFYRTTGELGELVVAAVNAPPPANTAGPIGKVVRYVGTGAGLAVISVNQPARAPAAA